MHPVLAAPSATALDCRATGQPLEGSGPRFARLLVLPKMEQVSHVQLYRHLNPRALRRAALPAFFSRVAALPVGGLIARVVIVTPPKSSPRTRSRRTAAARALTRSPRPAFQNGM